MYRFRFIYLLSFISCVLLSFELFAKDEDDYFEDCANALTAFRLPQPLNKIGASNINVKVVTESIDSRNIMTTLGEFSFPVNGQMHSIEILMTRPIDIDFPATESLEIFKNILGEMLEGSVSQVNIIFLKYEKDPSFEGVLGRFSSSVMPRIYILPDHQLPPSPSMNQQGYHRLLMNHALSTLRHEVGHLIAYYKYGTATPDQKWRDAVLADYASVSDYDDTSIEEDFAETVALYLRTHGGLYYPRTSRRFVHRFKILDEIFGITSLQREQITQMNELFERWIDDVIPP